MAAAPSQVRIRGPLASYQASFAAALSERGYTALSAANQLRVMAHLSRWLADHALMPGDLGPGLVQEFLRARREQGYTCWLSERGLGPLLEHLRALGVVAAIAPHRPVTPLDQLLDRYRTYLLSERGLVASTVSYYEADARLFLADRSGPAGLDLTALSAGDVARFVVRECARRSRGQAKILVTALRSLLRFLHVEGLTAELASAVPSVAGWRGASLPRGIPPNQVQALLRSCDRRAAVGRRDLAILVLLARLGLRAGEVAALQLEDVDWRRGEIVVRGKGRRDERLPLPVDVGEALVGYLEHGRPHVDDCRRFFLRIHAPHQQLTTGAVTVVVASACRRAGVPEVGAHCLRHAAATEILRDGSSLAEVGQVLRHRSPITTAGYAKVDRVALRALALPWPGGVA